jgi:hypothetical protein
VLFTQTKLRALNMNPKLRFQNGVGTEFSCSKHGLKNLKSRNLKLRIIMHFYMGFWPGLQKEQQMQEYLQLRNLNWDSIVYRIIRAK